MGVPSSKSSSGERGTRLCGEATTWCGGSGLLKIDEDALHSDGTSPIMTGVLWDRERLTTVSCPTEMGDCARASAPRDVREVSSSSFPFDPLRFLTKPANMEVLVRLENLDESLLLFAGPGDEDPMPVINESSERANSATLLDDGPSLLAESNGGGPNSPPPVAAAVGEAGGEGDGLPVAMLGVEECTPPPDVAVVVEEEEEGALVIDEEDWWWCWSDDGAPEAVVMGDADVESRFLPSLPFRPSPLVLEDLCLSRKLLGLSEEFPARLDENLDFGVVTISSLLFCFR